MTYGKDFGTERHRERGRGRTAFWIALTLGLASAFALWRPAETRFGATDSIADWELDRVARVLDLGDTQIQQIAPVYERVRTAVADITEERDELERELIALLEADRLDDERREALENRALALTAVAVDASLDAIAEIWPALTAEQQARLLRHWRHRG